MFAKLFSVLKNIDWLLAAPVVLLCLLSLSELYSMDVGQSGRLFEKQLLVLVVGCFLILLIVWLDYSIWYSSAPIIYLLAGLLLLAVLLFGSTINNTKGWFAFGSLGNFQPVEFAKAALILMLARYFARANSLRRPWLSFVNSLFLVLIPVGLVMLQPDLGSAVILLAIWLLLLALSGWPKRYLLGLFAVLLCLSLLGWQFLADYQKQRIVGVFLDRGGALTTDYNVNQAIIAVGSGQWFGRGLGYGSQSQLRFLPEAKTDFIFAVIAEELGLMGVIGVCCCFLIIFWRIIANLSICKDNFSIFFLLGFGILIFLQMFINIGMNLGLLPVVGITLPFLSYGGSSLAINLLLLGIAQSIVVRTKLKNY